ncbi:MAG: GcrA family cell cycle regulator [Candidatus Bathyarchaeia archaeon]
MGLFEELIGKYPLEDVPPLGSCLVVPANEFRREWEERLKAEGCKIYVQAYGGQACFFIKPPSASNKQAAQSAEAAEPKAGRKSPIDWTPELIERLKELRMKGLSYRAIARELGLSPDSVYKQLRRLGLSSPIKEQKEETKPAPKPEVSSPRMDSLSELIESLRLLHEHGFKRACLILLQNAKSFLEESPA